VLPALSISSFNIEGRSKWREVVTYVIMGVAEGVAISCCLSCFRAILRNIIEYFGAAAF